jgi:hypothetical protein
MGKYKKLGLSVILDIIGVITVFDVIWAPLSAYIMTKMYPGGKGKAAGIFLFIEEISPGFDIIPTFTIMWFYTYVFNKKEAPVIEVKS